VQTLQAAPVEQVPIEALLRDAVSLALELRHPVYDCLYLALAAQRGTFMVTADQRLVEAVRRQPGRADLVVLLGEPLDRPRT
jgi:predicted nucleic acid-binding protein